MAIPVETARRERPNEWRKPWENAPHILSQWKCDKQLHDLKIIQWSSTTTYCFCLYSISIPLLLSNYFITLYTYVCITYFYYLPLTIISNLSLLLQYPLPYTPIPLSCSSVHSVKTAWMTVNDVTILTVCKIHVVCSQVQKWAMCCVFCELHRSCELFFKMEFDRKYTSVPNS